ncbi:LOW QUALITY PROTEIN: protein expanded [Nasonia vitripennis]|uniref:FERM domain-containing protein n=1 Tax=Nasonia vitripennis TaxID=7425 RepID=A0A7M7G5E5_NASVI|nr:LOW QUALITY PROTEIN: protein expanded [Nasonia vitripennis]
MKHAACVVAVSRLRGPAQPLVSASRYLAVHALPGDPLYFIVDAKSKVKEVYAQTCQLLGQQGMQDCELFGLAILSDGEYLFVDQESKLSKYAPKNWRSSHTYGLDSSGRPAFVLYFRVRYYVDTPLLLSDETTRHHYYLQLRDNVVRHGGGVESWQGQKSQHPLQTGSVYGPLLSLAGLALQADLGDYTEERHRRQGYCKPSDYLPAHMCHEDNALSVLAAQHRDNRGLSREEAELSYIREAVLLEAPLNAHLYRLRRSKSEQGPGRVLLAICARGVRVYGDEETPQVFTWNNIGKLGFDRKKFEIRAVDQPGKLTLFSGCDDKSKLLLALCRDTHQFFMAIAPRVSEAKRREEEERKVLRDCYMYPARCKLSLTTRGSRADQRISLISTTSSNTTSGIVSDRVHSEDEPDAGPVSTGSTGSTEDSSNGAASATAVTNGATATASVDGNESPIPPPLRPSLLADADAGATNISGAALGSQCSSTCSTVVVNATSETGNRGSSIAGSATSALLKAAAAASGRRRTSASSSLELGYSHTAQNSALSGEPIYDRCNKTVKYAGTDIASETSGVYTLRSSEMLDEPMANDSSVQSTTDEASVTSGFYTIHSGLRSETSGSCYSQGTGHDEQDPIYSLCQGEEPTRKLGQPDVSKQSNEAAAVEEDDENEGRSRSNSILSAGSFRGDGSDPSGQGPLLSADELSDLIVGRYPPRKSIGASMDSDCDYVRMPPPPPPPAPPPRSDSERQLPPPPPYPGLGVSQPPVVPGPPPPGYGCPRERFEIPPPTPPRNDAITPREPPPPPPPPARIQPPTYPGDKMKPTPVHAPVAALVVGPNNYLDVHATRTGPVLLPYLTPPHPPHPQVQQRQPPPPPPPPQTANASANSANAGAAVAAQGMLATVYTSQVARSQIEQYKQQLYSDVDYVMFPLKDPALSKQEYIDAKTGSHMAAMAAMAAYPPPPPYPLQAANKSSLMYRSTPYLPYTGGSYSSLSNKYASNQNLASSLSDTNSSVGNNYLLYGNASSQYAASTSSLYSGLTCSSGGGGAGSQTFRKEGTYASPPPPLPPPASARHHPHTLQHGFSRTRSHENILKSYDAASASLSSLSLSHGGLKSPVQMGSLPQPQTKHRRLPPPPPPPPYDIQSLAPSQPACLGISEGKLTQQPQAQQQQPQHQQQQSQSQQNGMLDIKTLREKSRNLDLPLISALCNDRYLLKQTKAFVLPKHPSESSSTGASKSGARNGSSSNGGSSSSRQKYPVSGLSTTQITKPPRKSSNSTHKHPSTSTASLLTKSFIGNAYQVNSSTNVAANDKNLSRASHS